MLLESLLAGLLKVTFNYAQFKEVYDKGDSFFINWCENSSIANNASECIESVNASFGANLVSMDIWWQYSPGSDGARGGSRMQLEPCRHRRYRIDTVPRI